MGRRCAWVRTLGSAVAWSSVVACTQPTSHPGELVDPPPVGHDGGSIVNPGDDSGTDDGGGGGCYTPPPGGCNSLQNCGAQVHVVQMAQSAPPATGGTVADGTYVLTSYALYTGSGGASGTNGTWFSETMTIMSGGGDGGAAAWQDTSVNSQSPLATSAGTIGFFPPDTVEIDYTCPPNQPFTATYTASSTSLTLAYDTQGGVSVITYTKQ